VKLVPSPNPLRRPPLKPPMPKLKGERVANASRLPCRTSTSATCSD
jgi:hypothetical protein